MQPQEIEKVFRLWDDLSDFGMHGTDEAINHCLKTLGEWLDAHNAFWVGIVQVLDEDDRKEDVMRGWRLGAFHSELRRTPYPEDRSTMKVIHTDKEARWTRGGNKPAQPQAQDDPGATNLALAQGGGTFRAYTLLSEELVNVAKFATTAHYDFYYRKPGIIDRIWVIVPVNAEAESCFCFDRVGTQRPFSREDLELAAFTLRGIKWFHRHVLMTHGLGVSTQPLTSTEHRVVKHLLTGNSEKRIAADLGMTQGTVHQYATRIYKKFGARGRAEFTSVWLGGRV